MLEKINSIILKQSFRLNCISTISNRMNIDTAANMLAELGNAHRLATFRLLVRAGPDGLPVKAIQNHLGIPKSTLSHHVLHMVSAGIVTQTVPCDGAGKHFALLTVIDGSGGWSASDGAGPTYLRDRGGSHRYGDPRRGRLRVAGATLLLRCDPLDRGLAGGRCTAWSRNGILDQLALDEH